MPKPNRSRSGTALLLSLVIAAGVASRTAGRGVPVTGKELGDLLWPVMFYLLALLIAPRLRPTSAAAIALLFSMGTEALQAYQAPWINALRDRPVIGMLLGRQFAWHDMACFAIGTAAAWGVDRAAQGRTARRHRAGGGMRPG